MLAAHNWTWCVHKPADWLTLTISIAREEPGMLRLSGLLSLLWLLCLLSVLPGASAQTLRLPALQTTQVSVSGLSAGGYMAVQFEVAFSASVTGAGVIAGGPYNCAQGTLYLATTVCSCTSDLLACRVRAGGTQVSLLVDDTALLARRGLIDDPTHLAQHRVWLFSGSADSVVPRAVMNDLRSYYRHYLAPGQISYQSSFAAEHAMPTDDYGNACAFLGSPYINNCAYDAAGQLLGWLYGPLSPRNSGAPAGQWLAFDQAEFLPLPTLHGMANNGLLYLPPGCDAQAAGCKLHVVFHGCLQDSQHIGREFPEHAGYTAWADSNRIVLLFPQAAPIYPFTNPKACWDWFGYDDALYATRLGHQMAAIKRMVDRLTGLAPGLRCRRGRCTS